MLDVEFQENPLKGRSVTAEKVLYSLSKVSFFRDRLRPNLEVLLDMEAESRCGVSGKPLLHDHPSCLCCPDPLSMVGDSLLGNGCGSPNHISFYLLNLLLIK